jgi:hypothetical protein
MQNLPPSESCYRLLRGCASVFETVNTLTPEQANCAIVESFAIFFAQRAHEARAPQEMRAALLDAIDRQLGNNGLSAPPATLGGSWWRRFIKERAA